jgi:hypothetical protein
MAKKRGGAKAKRATPAKKNPAAQELGRKRWKGVTAAQRSQLARLAVLTRWRKVPPPLSPEEARVVAERLKEPDKS